MNFSLRRRDTAFLFFTQSTPPDSFPAHPVELAREMVTVSHFDAKRVKELLKTRPALANAAVDWGFGDWEDALGAASHVGNREIAEILLAQGARPTIFSAAMLGQLEVVDAFLKSQPLLRRTKGPHGISLFAHARDKATLDYLRGLADAEPPKMPALKAGDGAPFIGTYVFGKGPNDAVEIQEKNGTLVFMRKGTPARNLVWVGASVFHPVGAPEVVISFHGGVMTVRDGTLVLNATAAR